MNKKLHTVLVLEGATTDSDRLKSSLEKNGKKVITVSDGDEVSSHVNENVDLIIASQAYRSKTKSNTQNIPMLLTMDADEDSTDDIAASDEVQTIHSREANDILDKVNLMLEISSLKAQLRAKSDECDSLKNEVAKLTEQTTAANQEMQSFAYTVSHDLRAPLRAINGFTQILEEEHGKSLNEEGKRLFAMIRQNSLKMGRLIDSLLTLSRVNRKELLIEEINMNDLVFMTVEELKKSQTVKADIKIEDLPAAHADLSLLKQVWSNLLSNAVKFSSAKENPVVSVGGYKEGNEVVYYVKDNGAGFNMEYAGKLFGVFQRLHSESEFEGVGIGLAIVKRVISMHNGRVWAEGKQSEGATFYFTLPILNAE